MTDGALLLGLLLLASRDNKAPAAPGGGGGPPRWPTPLSPPPMPAFQSQIPPPPSADTATPLSELHRAPPKVRPVDKSGPAARAAAAAAARASAARDVAHSVKVPLHVKIPGRAAPERTAAAVIDLQKVVNARGGKLKPDGLYGPKTASAWSALARSKGLPATISRGGPKTAWVESRTYDALRVPPIP